MFLERVFFFLTIFYPKMNVDGWEGFNWCGEATILDLHLKGSLFFGPAVALFQ